MPENPAPPAPDDDVRDPATPDAPDTDLPDPADTAAPRARRKKRPTAAQTMGGIIFGFEQQVWRTAPPPQELVEHARPDKPVAAPDGSLLTIVLPDALSIDDDKETR